MIPGHNDLGPTGERPFQYSIVWLILDHLQSSPRLDGKSEAREKHGNMGELFGITREFGGQKPEQLIEDGLGDNELVLLL